MDLTQAFAVAAATVVMALTPPQGELARLAARAQQAAETQQAQWLAVAQTLAAELIDAKPEQRLDASPIPDACIHARITPL